MKPDDLDDVVDRVSDGTSIPWDRLLDSPDQDERRLLEQLRTLDAIARLHRSTADPAEAPASATEPERDTAPPRTAIGRWAHLELLDRLGRGSYGEVFRAWDPRLEREVALKLLPLAGGSSGRTVVREARMLARVRHRNVLTVHGALVAEGRVGIWTELVEGQTLDEFIRGAGLLSAPEAMLLGATICRAVHAVHAAGLLHRDIKAQNVMRSRAGRIVLMDFGAGGELTPDRRERTPSLTGTPAYIAPEILEGHSASVRSDIYSIGVLLFYVVTGEFPVAGGTLTEVRAAHARGARRPLSTFRQDLPSGFVRTVERACAPDPAARHEDAAALGRDLMAGLGAADETARSSRGPAWWQWATAAVVLAAIGLAVLGLVTTARDPDPPAFARLTFREGKVHSARFGPDGGTVIYSASWGRDRPQIYLTTVGGRESRPIGAADATLLAVSPQGEMAIASAPRFLRGYVEAGVLARMPLSGGGARAVLEGVQAADWSPDGRDLAVVRDVEGQTQLEFPIGTVLYRSSGWMSSPRVSRDGSAVALLDHPTLNDDSGRVLLVTRAGEIRQLTGDWVSIQGLAWSADSREVWFTASVAGNMRAVHAVDLDGDVRLIHRGSTKLRLHDVSGDGRALVTGSDERVELLVRTDGKAEERDLSWLDWSIVRDISTDGRTLLINESGEGGGEQYAIYLRDVQGGEAVRLADGSGISLSPDGRWVLASTRGATPRLMLLPTGAGSPRELPGSGLRYQQWGGWFPDGRQVLFSARPAGKGTRLFVQRVDGGSAPVPIGEEGMTLGSAGAVAPDGTRFAAVSAAGRIGIYTPEGRLLREVAGTVPGEVPLQWTADGGWLYVGSRGPVPQSVYLVDLRTGARRLWRELMPNEPSGAQEILRVAISRDGKTCAYSLSRELSELYLMSFGR